MCICTLQAHHFLALPQLCGGDKKGSHNPLNRLLAGAGEYAYVSSCGLRDHKAEYGARYDHRGWQAVRAQRGPGLDSHACCAECSCQLGSA